MELNLRETLFKHYTNLTSLGYNVFCVCVNGSQCYNLDDEKSDIDTIAWVIPHLTDLIKPEPLEHKKLKMESGDCVVWDIRYVFDLFEKGKFLQYIPFWEEKYVPFRHRDTFMEFFESIKFLPFYNFPEMSKKFIGMANSSKRLVKSNLEKGETEKAGKSLSYICWLYDSYINMLTAEAEDFQNSYKIIDSKKKKCFLDIKRGRLPGVISYEQACSLADALFDIVNQHKNSCHTEERKNLKRLEWIVKKILSDVVLNERFYS